MGKNYHTMSGNQAAATMAYALSDAAAIYPITPSSDMAEACDEFASKGKQNIFGQVPRVIEMQSEAGAAGTLHGLLAAGALGVTFTASQGLLLKIPNMYKICGELLPGVMHVSARALASHALSIFGDHSDVMSVRSTGWAMLSSNSVQEAQDMALIAHLSAIEASYPFLHFFDGFRTSHEFNKVEAIDYDTVKKLVKELGLEKKIADFRKRALSSKHPHQMGTAQNPDTYFQNREACNTVVNSLPGVVTKMMNAVGKATGRQYKPFEYIGRPDTPWHIIIGMGSSMETVEEYLETAKTAPAKSNDPNGLHFGGAIKVRMYRPFDAKAFIDTIPASVKTITVLDRTKENGAIGDPLYMDVCTALIESGRTDIKVLGGRYGLSSKEFTPEMVHAIFENMNAATPKNHFTIGINDDVTHTSLAVSPWADTGSAPTPITGITECKFFGLGSDGTVGANKNSCAIVGDNTDLFSQAYFVYDSKKSGAATISHLRFSNNPIKSAYLVNHPSFVACHNQAFLGKFDMLKGIKQGGTFLLNTTYTAEELEKILPAEMKKALHDKKINFYIINAYKIAASIGLKTRVNTIMQSAFFKLTEIIPFEQAKKLMKTAAEKSYGKKGAAVLDMNYAAIDSADTNLVKVEIPEGWGALTKNEELRTKNVCNNKYYNEFCHPINSLQGDTLPVSAFNPDGRVPTATSQYERRNIATQLPHWIEENCIKCNFCALVCPHATIRAHMDKDKHILQLNPHDCTGCGVCANVCPSKNKALVMKDFSDPCFKDTAKKYAHSLTLPYPEIEPTNIKNSQFLKPYFEFSGACAGCGETPYIKLATQLFGKRMIIANATGCSSIYGGSSPTCPYTVDKDGRGPAWANSLFEDNAEFGYGIKHAKEIIKEDASVWIVGGDGWAYDIGYGGLDHVIAQNLDVNLLVMDTEVYSNTGGQASKATPAGSIAKFAASGKVTHKKDLGAMAMNYPNVYIAQVVMGANYAQTLTAFKEAEAHKGPSIIIAYSTCINHGIDMSQSMKTMKNAVDAGYWVLYRRKPATATCAPELIIDSPEPKGSYQEFLANENRYKALEKTNPEAAKQLFAAAELHAKRNFEKYKRMAGK